MKETNTNKRDDTMTENEKTIARLQEIYDAADEGGTIQANAMVELFPGEPTRHTTASMEQVAMWSGIDVLSVRERLGY